MDSKLSKIYYSPQGYWKGLAAVKKLSTVAKVSEEVAKKWLVKQALWQLFFRVRVHSSNSRSLGAKGSKRIKDQRPLQFRL